MMIRPNDIVYHRPTGGTWVVCGINNDLGYLILCGYPFPSVAKISDCELVEEGYTKNGQPDEYVQALERAGYPTFVYKEGSV